MAGELIGIARGPFGCGEDGLHWLLEPEVGERSSCPCGTVARYTPRDRYCMARCYCGHCPQYEPVPEVNYRRVVARMQEEEREKRHRRARELERLSGQRKPRGNWSNRSR